jgi:hypothetical protein
LTSLTLAQLLAIAVNNTRQELSVAEIALDIQAQCLEDIEDTWLQSTPVLGMLMSNVDVMETIIEAKKIELKELIERLDMARGKA